MKGGSQAVRWAVLVPAALLIVAASTLLGPTRLRCADIFGADPGGVFWHFRVPRTLLAACAGAGLAVGGVVFQALFRNALAEPYTLGIASGASLGAAIAFLSGLSGHALGVPRRSFAALLGALLAMGLVYLLARLRAGREMTRLLLTGVCVAYMCAAGILLATYLADRAVTNDIVKWMMGSLATLEPYASVEIAAILVPVLLFVLYEHRGLDLLATGDDLAASRGVAVGRVVWASFVLVGVLVAVIVANCGPIGFVGLMVPHVARGIVGVRALPLTVSAVLLGAAFLAACDGVARSVSVYEIPVGVVTNILGAGFFIYLLATRDVSYAGHAR